MTNNDIIFQNSLNFNDEYEDGNDEYGVIKSKLIKHLQGLDEVRVKPGTSQKKSKDISYLIGKDFSDNQVVYHFDDDKKIIQYKTEHIMPKNVYHRIPVMLLVSNPHPVSVSNGLPFSEGHSVGFWCSLFGCETPFPKNVNPDLKEYDCRKIGKDPNERQRIGNKLDAGDYNSDFLLYFYCYWELPTKSYPRLEQIFRHTNAWNKMCLEGLNRFNKMIQTKEFGIRNIIVFADPPLKEITGLGNSDYEYKGWEDKVKRSLSGPDNVKDLFKEDPDSPDNIQGKFLYKMPIHSKVDPNTRVYRSLSTHIKDRYFTELLERIFKYISTHNK